MTERKRSSWGTGDHGERECRLKALCMKVKQAAAYDKTTNSIFIADFAT